MRNTIYIIANQPGISVVDENQKSALVIDKVPTGRNIRKKEYEKLEKYQRLKEEFKKVWKVGTLKSLKLKTWFQ